MRRWVGIVLILAVGVGALATLVVSRRVHERMRLKVYFRDAEGLHLGAPVRLAGVDIGTITSVCARPELRERPAEVLMSIQTKYDLSIPRDAVVVLSTAGVLGQTFAEIDVSNATGPPVINGGVLQTREVEKLTTQQLLNHIAVLAKIAEVAQKKGCEPAKVAPQARP